VNPGTACPKAFMRATSCALPPVAGAAAGAAGRATSGTSAALPLSEAITRRELNAGIKGNVQVSFTSSLDSQDFDVEHQRRI